VQMKESSDKKLSDAKKSRVTISEGGDSAW
jgi:hypothetical protein